VKLVQRHPNPWQSELFTIGETARIENAFALFWANNPFAPFWANDPFALFWANAHLHFFRANDSARQSQSPLAVSQSPSASTDPHDQSKHYIFRSLIFIKGEGGCCIDISQNPLGSSCFLLAWAKGKGHKKVHLGWPPPAFVSGYGKNKKI
jgi:hypothetical protein